jgi:zinc and cadmium transporter
VTILLILWIILLSLLGSIGALATAAAFLLLRDEAQKALIPSLVSFASGTLLAAALLGLIPSALENTAHLSILSTVLVGIVVFFLLEKLVVWRHCHYAKCEVHGIAGPMILMGDLFHNATDGFVIAASFLSSIPIGLVASISIIAHEIPQEVGDFAILLDGGYSKRKALLLNTLSSLSTLPAAILAYLALDTLKFAIPYVIAFSAASFLYIALTDLYPQLHQKTGFKPTIEQIVMILSGIGIMILFLQLHV